MHYLGKPGPHHSKRGGVGGGGGVEEVSPRWPYTSYFFSTPPPPPSSSERWTALYPVSTRPRCQIRELLMELSLVLVYLVPSHQVQVSSSTFFFLQMGTEKRGYELSTQHLATTKQYQVSQRKHHISATWETFKQPFFPRRRRDSVNLLWCAHPVSPGLGLKAQRDLF